MTDEQWKLYRDFCQFAGLQDNSDAKIPNAILGLKTALEQDKIKDWDTLDDISMVSPEFLVYILQKAESFFYPIKRRTK